jgi:hypothetical protein
MREISREEVREFLDKVPAMRDRIADTCRRELGAEPPAELVDAVVLEIGRRLLENASARLSEITEEEYGRIAEEEYERLDTGGGVEEERHSAAARDRVVREYAYLFGRP